MFSVQIPMVNVQSLKERIAMINKRAAKLEMPPITLEEGEVVYNEEQSTRYQVIEIHGETPILPGGWKLGASLKYEKDITLLTTYSGFSVPEKYRNVKPFCEHCQTHRVKKFTFVLVNAEGESINVGRSCMKDFIGKNINDIVRSYEWIRELLDELEDEESGWYGPSRGKFSEEYPRADILMLGAYHVNKFGFIPAASDDTPTRDHVIRDLSRNVSYEFSPEDHALANEAVEWICNEESGSDFIANCQNLLTLEWIPKYAVGYLVGMMGSYLRVKNKKQSYEILDETFGVIGTRYDIELTLVRVVEMMGYYGSTYIHTFRDADMRAYVWFGSKYLRTADGNGCVQDGETVKVKATIKDHSKYNDKAQTVLTRVKAAKDK